MIEGVFLLLGCNVGDSSNQVSIAESLISERVGPVLASSSLYQTKAWGFEDQPDFLNKVLKVSTSLTPTELLRETQVIEKELGREKKTKWGPREMDIDILFYGDQIINQIDLKIPHPEILNRRFTLEPLAEVDPALVHPIFQKSVSQLLQDCADPLAVSLLET